MEWLACSPDHNLIERVWGTLERSVAARPKSPVTWGTRGSDFFKTGTAFPKVSSITLWHPCKISVWQSQHFGETTHLIKQPVSFPNNQLFFHLRVTKVLS
ncbi:hypothetical protein TNCV_3663411 [Trichonephila clavipes]|nr:hypothetical protein TNCV_3663411 [Trichonephila clavipes]